MLHQLWENSIVDLVLGRLSRIRQCSAAGVCQRILMQGKCSTVRGLCSDHCSGTGFLFFDTFLPEMKFREHYIPRI